MHNDDPNNKDSDAFDGVTALALAHEVHQPLTYLIASLAALRHSLGVSPVEGAAQLRSWIDRARASAEHIGKLVRNAGPVYLVERTQRIDLSALVAGTLDIVAAEVERRAQLDRELSPSVWVFGDETRLRQVVLNLVMNAWLALPDDQAVRHRIVVRVERLESRAIIEVEDDGRGAADDLMNRLAGAYFTTQHDGRGNAIGLGMAVCKRIVLGCGGAIEQARGRHGGTLVRAVLPACEEQNG